jgi:SAM-dependent methyltransferase
MKFADKVLSQYKFSTFFEVGCGSSGWLPYFARHYGYKVSGLDYSEIGCQLAKKNLEILNIDYDVILCKDFFLPDPTEGKKFDVVFSYGVIEHFSNPKEIAGIFKNFLNEGGVMITLVPNFKGLIGKLTKRFIPDVYDIHNQISDSQLVDFHKDNSMKVLKHGYAGIFAFGVMPLIKSNHWLFRKETTRRKIFLGLINFADKIMSRIFRILPFDVPSQYFSPYVICIARK